MADDPNLKRALEAMSKAVGDLASKAKDAEKSVSNIDKGLQSANKSAEGVSKSLSVVFNPGGSLLSAPQGSVPASARGAITTGSSLFSGAPQQGGAAPGSPGGFAPAPNAAANAVNPPASATGPTTHPASSLAPTFSGAGGAATPGTTAAIAATNAQGASAAPNASQVAVGAPATPGVGVTTPTTLSNVAANAGSVTPLFQPPGGGGGGPSIPSPTNTAGGGWGPSGGGTATPIFMAPGAGGGGAGSGGGGGGGIAANPYALTPNQQGGNAPIGMLGSGEGSGGGGGGAMGMLFSGAKFLGGMALAGINDLRMGRDEALRYEESRLIARGGTGDFQRFAGNMERAMNKINVQNRTVIERDLAQAYGNYYAQAMGGARRENLGGPSGQVSTSGWNPFARLAENAMGVANRRPQEGEVRTAQTVGAMHTLASIGGIAPEAVGGALGAMYSSQSYYKAMASGIFTRDPSTGNMMTTEEIVNQYQGRMKGYSPDQLRRALAPGGAFRAELNQTWGDQGLVEMISEGILMTATTGEPIKAGNIEQSARDARYAGVRSTQGRDAEMRRQRAEESRLGAYVDDITAGVKTANNLVAGLNEWLAGLGDVGHKLVGIIETTGGIMDVFNTTMPQSTQKMVDALTSVAEKLTGLLGGEFFQDLIAGALPGASEGDWFVSKNMPINVHQGEMILPNRLATAVRTELAVGRTTVDSPTHTQGLKTKRGPNEGASVNIYLTVQNASDGEAMNFAKRVKKIIENDNELIAVGTGVFGTT